MDTAFNVYMSKALSGRQYNTTYAVRNKRERYSC